MVDGEEEELSCHRRVRGKKGREGRPLTCRVEKKLGKLKRLIYVI